jgi:hypothetical protein
MRVHIVLTALVAAAFQAGAADKPRVYVTESQALQVAGDGSVGDAKGSLLVSGGTSPQNVEVMRQFRLRCPEVVVTANREKADFLVRLDHEGPNPTTPFVRGNKVAIFDKNEDLVYSHSTRLLGNAVKGACAAIVGHKVK